jgi:hypothetical protein
MIHLNEINYLLKCKGMGSINETSEYNFLIIQFNTGYFTSDNELDGIENATHNTFAKQAWIWKRKMFRFALQMNYGLHFQFRRALVTREILSIYIFIETYIFKTVDVVNIFDKNEHVSDINHI